jgi:ankyrin repeat protein
MLALWTCACSREIDPEVVKAIQDDDVGKMREILDGSFDCQSMDQEKGRTALMWASGLGRTEIAGMLVEKGAQIDFSPREFTSLMLAAAGGHEKIVALLIKNGAEVSKPGFLGFTALHDAARNGHLGIVKLLVEAGADLDATNFRNSTPLIVAAFEKHQEVARYLVERGADVNIIDKQGMNAFIWAILGNQENLAQYLLDKGTDLKVVDKLGRNALYWAIHQDMPRIAKQLIAKGIDVNSQVSEGSLKGLTSLMAAVWHTPELVPLLIDKGADIHAKNNNGETALDLARKGKNHEVVQILKRAGAKD